MKCEATTRSGRRCSRNARADERFCAQHTQAEPLTVAAAVARDLADLAERGPKGRRLARSGLAASALALAKLIDDDANSATSRSMCAKALNDTLDRLLDLAPVAQEDDELDELRAKRAARRAGSAAATH